MKIRNTLTASAHARRPSVSAANEAFRHRHALRRTALAAALIVALTAPVLVAAPPEADYIGRLGFRDPKHTRYNDGYQASTVLGITPSGYTVGESDRFFGSANPNGLEDRSAWMANPWGGTRSVGLYDSAHKSSTGFHTSSIELFTRSGKVAGHSTRYEGQSDRRGQSAWIADWSGGTRRIGLYYDGAAPLADGSRFNQIVSLNELGQTIGIALVENGQSAWFASPDGSTRPLGFYDAAHTTPGAAPHNTPVVLNPSGTIVGNTQFSNTQVAWLHSKNGGPAIQIGLYDAEHHTPELPGWNTVVDLNIRGRAIGTARQVNSEYGYVDGWLRHPDGTMHLFSGGPTKRTEVFAITDSDLVAGTTGNPGGTTGWVYDIKTGTTTNVGLPDWEVAAYNTVLALTENGVAVGKMSYYGNADDFLWLAPRNGPTYQIGLDLQLSKFSPALNTVADINDAGYVVGTSGRTRSRAWIASPVTGQTYTIGLFDAQHTGLDNTQAHAVSQVTNSLFVAGYSVRYAADGTTPVGQTAWIYNSPAGAYARFDISVRPSDGYSYSEIRHVTENGTAFGMYRLYDDEGTYQGERAFVWMTKRGVRDLGDALDIDLAAAGWDHLEDAVVGNEAGYIAGQGKATEGDADGVFLVRTE